MSKRPANPLESKEPTAKKNSLDQDVNRVVDMLGKRFESIIPWNYEVELKVCSGDTYKSGVTGDEYHRTLSAIRKYPCWVETKTHTLDMAYPKNNRVSYNVDSKEYIGSMLKTRFQNTTWKSDFVDVKLKLSMSGEYAIVHGVGVDVNPVCLCQDWRAAQRSSGDAPTHIREKIRSSFAHSSGMIPWQLDVTTVQGGGMEIEVEFTPLIWELEPEEQKECVEDMLIWFKVLLNGHRSTVLPASVDYHLQLGFIVERTKVKREKKN